MRMTVLIPEHKTYLKDRKRINRTMVNFRYKHPKIICSERDMINRSRIGISGWIANLPILYNRGCWLQIGANFVAVYNLWSARKYIALTDVWWKVINRVGFGTKSTMPKIISCERYADCLTALFRSFTIMPTKRTKGKTISMLNCEWMCALYLN